MLLTGSAFNLLYINQTMQENIFFLWLTKPQYMQVLQNTKTRQNAAHVLFIHWRTPIFFKVRYSAVSYNYFQVLIYFYF